MNSPIDWNYYLSTDELYQIKHYEGYRSTNIVKTKSIWRFMQKNDKVKTQAVVRHSIGNAVSYPVGRTPLVEQFHLALVNYF